MKRYSWMILLLFSQVIYLFSQRNSAITNFVSNRIFRTAGMSIAIADGVSGKVIASYLPNLNLTPASTLKLITTSSALEMFGPEYCFETRVDMSGIITKDGVLQGDIYIIGDGDPTIGSMYSLQAGTSFFKKIIESLRKNGVKAISGRIIGDESAYNTELIPAKIPWEDMGNYYAAGVSAVNYGDNSYKITFKTGKPGDVPLITNVSPKIPNLSFQNYLIAKSNDKDSAFIYGMPYCGERYMYGSVPADRNIFSIKGDVPDPALFMADQLTKYLSDNGVIISGDPTTSRILAKDGKFHKGVTSELCSYKSDPLSQIIQVTNKRSNNFYAEALLRLISSKVNNHASISGGIAALKQYWAVRKIKTDFLMYDGSGLSPANRVNAMFFVELLHYMSNKSRYSNVFISSLAVAGVDGTLKSFLSSTLLSGKVKAKSGSFDGVISYCGLLEKNGRKYEFCILVNAFTCSSTEVKKAIEKLLIDF